MAESKKKLVYVVSFIKSIDPYELPVAVLHSQKALSKFFDEPLRNIQRQFDYGCTVAFIDRYKIEKVFIDYDL